MRGGAHGRSLVLKKQGHWSLYDKLLGAEGCSNADVGCCALGQVDVKQDVK